MSALEQAYNRRIYTLARAVGWPGDGSPVQWMAGEIARLQAIVDRLPKDAAGNPISPGATLRIDIGDLHWTAEAVMGLKQPTEQCAPLELIGWLEWRLAEKAREA